MATPPGRSAPCLPQQVAQLLCGGPAAGCGRHQGAPLQPQLDWCQRLQSTVLRPWLQHSPGEAGAALPLQVRLVLLRPLSPLRERQRPVHLQVGCGHATAGTQLHAIASTHLLEGRGHTIATQHNRISTIVSRQWTHLQ